MILVTGAKGHIGNVLIRLLHEKGHNDLRLMVSSGSAEHVQAFAKEVKCCDIRDARAVSEAVRGCTDVFHLAGFINMSASNKQLLYDINVGGVRNIVNACREHGVKRLVHVSSIHALAPSAQGCVDETIDDNPARISDEYGRSKLGGTLEVLDACQKGLDAVVVFPTGVIGPHDYRSSMSGIMFKKYIHAHGLQLYFDGQYDFVDVRDVADGIYRAWTQGEKGEGYILTGAPCSIRQMIEQIARCTGVSFKMLRVPTWVVKACARVTPLYYAIAHKTPVITKETVDVMVSGVNICGDKAHQKLGFTPRPLEETMRDTVEWHLRAES